MLNKRWKEMVEHNYHKSLDHRSFYFRATDKKNTGTRALITELIGKAVEKTPTAENPLATTSLPAPHIVLEFPKNCDYAHKDAYKVIMFAVEKSQLSPSDKERAGRMWRDFLGPLLGYDQNWVHGVSVLDDSIPTDPIPPGALVSTAFGEGTVEAFDKAKGFYKVQLKFGVGFLRPAQIHCSTLPVETSRLYDKYLKEDVASKEPPMAPGHSLVMGTGSLYVFLRLYNHLVSRLVVAKQLSVEQAGEVSKHTRLYRSAP